MKKRDIDILNDLARFRCLTRDQIIEMYFKDLKQPVTGCNTVLKRLRRDGVIDVSKERQPYIYFPSPAGIKKDSTKIPHFLKIADFYISLVKIEAPKSFIVEPKYGKKGLYMEPDAFTIWKKAPFFIEIQRSIYSDKVMNEKIKRYEDYYLSNEWQKEPWQPQTKKVFPAIILVTDTRYKIESDIRFIQVQNIEQLMNTLSPKLQNEPIKARVNINTPSITLKSS